MTAPSTSTEQRCDAWRTRATSTCQLNRRIDVEANIRYRCDEDSTRIHKTCHRTLTKTCTDYGKCSNKGLNPRSFGTDFPTWIAPNGNIAVGGRSTNWHGPRRCNTENRHITFEVKDVEKVRTFRIIGGQFDDAIGIKVNGQLAYVSPGSILGGQIRADTQTRPRYKCDRVGGRDGSRKCWNYTETITGIFNERGKHLSGCDRYITHSMSNIDIKRFLRNGHNRIDVRVIHNGVSVAWFEIQADILCCSQHQETWRETC